MSSSLVSNVITRPQPKLIYQHMSRQYKWKYSPSCKLGLPSTNSTANVCRTWVNSNSFVMGWNLTILSFQGSWCIDGFILVLKNWRDLRRDFDEYLTCTLKIYTFKNLHVGSMFALFVCETLVVIDSFYYGLVEEFLKLITRLICALCSWLRRGWHPWRGRHIRAGRAKVQLGVDAEGGVHHQARDRAIDQPALMWTLRQWSCAGSS